MTAQLKAEDFHGPNSVKISAKSTGYYPLEFAPQWICEKEGTLVLTNTTTGDKYEYTLTGTGEEPLAESHTVLECQARKPQTVSFRPFNVAADGQPCELTVDSDLMHLSGSPTVSVPARPKGHNAKPAEAAYVLTINPQMSGTVQGSITFTAPDGRYLWYTLELRTTPPPAEKMLDIVAPLRKVVAVEIPILNPSDAPLEFEVAVQGVGLLGDETITVPAGPNTSGTYELLFSPLVAGVSYGSIAFLNPIAGEFWYELKLVAEAAVPVELPLLQAPVGGSVQHTFAITNPVGDELPLRVTCSEPRNLSSSWRAAGRSCCRRTARWRRWSRTRPRCSTRSRARRSRCSTPRWASGSTRRAAWGTSRTRWSTPR